MIERHCATCGEPMPSGTDGALNEDDESFVVRIPGLDDEAVIVPSGWSQIVMFDKCLFLCPGATNIIRRDNEAVEGSERDIRAKIAEAKKRTIFQTD